MRYKRYLVLFLLLSVLTSIVLVDNSSDIDETPEKPDIVLIVIDSLRADYVDCKKKPSLTENMCSLSEDAAVFKNAYSHASFTTASMSAVMTGEHPWNIDMMNYTDSSLPNEVETVPEYLKKRDYRTKGYYEIGAVSPEYGFDQGFDLYENYFVWINSINFEDTFNESGEPEFTYFHLFGPHQPFLSNNTCSDFSRKMKDTEPTGEFEMKKRYIDNSSKKLVRECYRDEVISADKRVGDLLENLKRSGNYRDSMIILTSDHGEGLWDGQVRGHFGPVYEEQIKVPLIVKFPGNRYSGEKVEDYSRLKDIKPTIEHVVEGAGQEKTSFLDVIEGEKVGEVKSWTVDTKAVIKDDLKLVRTDRNNEYELYNLSDGEERKNIFGEVDVKKMKESIKEMEVTRYNTSKPGREIEERLEDLGYVK